MATKKGGKTVVRGADGALYFLSKKAAPVKLTAEQTQKVQDVLKDAEAKLDAIMDEEMSRVGFDCTEAVHITIPDVLIE
jgi:hypothetical protein